MANGSDVDVSVLSLLIERERILAGQTTVFQAYLECVKADYVKQNPNHEFKVYFIPMIQDRWLTFSAAQKAPYRRLNRLQSKAIAAKCRVIDQKIIAAKPGTRDYRGFPICSAADNARADEMAMLAFDPLFWYAMNVHVNESQRNPDYEWRDDFQRLLVDAAEKWSSLEPENQEMYITRAKIEWRAYHGKAERDDEGTEIVDAILANKLAAHQYEKTVGKACDASSDEEEVVTQDS